MSSAPSMPLFLDAYLADTTHLSTEEHGAYLLLLMAMWRRNGAVLDNDSDLARIVGLGARRWRSIKARLMPLLTVANGYVSAPHLSEFIARAGRKPISPALRRIVLERDGEVCAYCGATNVGLQIDHVLPVSRGGTNDPVNLQPACIECNADKRAQTPEEWLS